MSMLEVRDYIKSSVIPTRYFLGRPDIGEEMHISIEKGKTLIIRLMAVGPVVEGRAQRDVWFEVNGEVRKNYSSASAPHPFISTFIRFVRYLSKIKTLQSKQYRGKKPLQILDLSLLPCQVLW